MFGGLNPSQDGNQPSMYVGVRWGNDGYARRVTKAAFMRASSFISAISGTGVQRRDVSAIEMHQTGLLPPQQSVYGARSPITSPQALFESDMASFPGTNVPTNIALLGLDSRTGGLG